MKTVLESDARGGVPWQEIGYVNRALVGQLTIRQRATQDGPDRGLLVAGPEGVYVPGFYDNRCVLKAMMGYRYAGGGGWTDDWQAGGANCPSSAEQQSAPWLTWLRFPAGIYGARSTGSFELCGTGCHTYGGYTTFIFTPTTTVLVVTASPPNVIIGDSVTFTVSRDDNVPIPAVDKWVWTPKDGGSARTVACATTSTTCKTAVWEDGWMFALVVIDGYVHTKHAGVRVLPPELVLDASPLQPKRGRDVTYRASTDPANRSIAVSRWRFVPDAPGDTTAPCGTANPCVDPATVAGTMWVYATIEGRWTDSASAHITPYAEFKLKASRSTVSAGEVVKFTPELDGQTVASSAWRWERNDPATADTEVCAGGTTECDASIQSSGTMWAYLGTGEAADSADAPVMVTVPDDCVGGSASRLGNRTLTVSAVCAPPPDDPDPKYKLRVIAYRAPVTKAKGMTGNPLPSGADTIVELDFSRNEVVPYSYSAASGYENPVVVIDDTARASSGTITMSGNHTIEVVSDPLFHVIPSVQAAATRINAFLDASNKPLEYERFLRWHAAQVRDLGVDSATRVVELGEYVAADPLTQGARLAAFDAAVGGTIFRVMRQGTSLSLTHQTPADYRNRGTPVLGSPAQRPLVEVIYVNGISTPVETAAESERHLTRVASQMGNWSRAEVTHFYNPTYSEQVKSWQAEPCGGRAQRDGRVRHPIVVEARFAACKLRNHIRREIQRDQLEAAAQFVRIKYDRLRDRVPPPQFVHDLVRVARGYHKAGLHAFFVAHSQGNLMLTEAVKLYPDFKTTLARSGKCVGVVSLASPLGKQYFGLEYDRFLHGFIMNGDVLFRFVPVDNDFPQETSHITLQARDALGTVPHDPILPSHWVWGDKLHSINPNYFEHEPNAQLIRRHLDFLFEECVGPS